MKKIAIFVEGQTEQIFLEKLIKEIIGEHNVNIQIEKSHKKGIEGKRAFIILKAASKKSAKKYYVLIRDCGGDGSVKSEIRSNYESLSNNSYSKIIGIRDVYPSFKLKDVPTLRKNMEFGMPTKPIKVSNILAIMEIEAWFLAEINHYPRIHNKLTITSIVKRIKFDPSKIKIETRNNPASDLNKIYNLVGLKYNKNKNVVQKTINVLDYNNIYFNLPSKINSLNELIEELNQFFS